MSESIISNKRECLICGTTLNLHRHHIYYGTANRRLSEKYGCWCYLCGKHHNLSDYGVHADKALDLRLKKHCQRVLEEQGWSREKMINIFGRSYL